MKYVSLVVIGLLGMLVPREASAAGNPAATNFFTTAPAENDVRNTDTLPVITVNGIDAMHGSPQVAFKVQDASGTRTYVLSRGDEREGIRIVAIDQNGETVTVNNHGTLQKIGIDHSMPVAASAEPVASVETSSVVLPPAIFPIRQSQPGIGPGVSVTVIGHRDPPPQINGLGPITPAGGAGVGGFFFPSTNGNATNTVRMPNTNASVPFTRPGQINPLIPPGATIPPSSARIPPPPVIPGGAGGASPDVGGSATTGAQGPPPSASPQPMPSSPPKR